MYGFESLEEVFVEVWQLLCGRFWGGLKRVCGEALVGREQACRTRAVGPGGHKQQLLDGHVTPVSVNSLTIFSKFIFQIASLAGHGAW